MRMERKVYKERREAWEQPVTVQALGAWQDPLPPHTRYLIGMCDSLLLISLPQHSLVWFGFNQ